MTFNLPIKKISGIIALLYCFIFFASPVWGELPEKKNPAVNGIVYLNTSAPETGSVKLDGEWEFYWNRLLEPKDFLKTGTAVHYIEFPGFWKDSTVGGIKLPGDGYATYRLKIINTDEKKTEALVISYVYSAFRLWINGEPLYQRGKLDTSGEAKMDFLFIHHRKVIPFTLENGVNQVVLQVLNYHYKSGGIENPVILGDAQTELKKKLYEDTISMIAVGILLFVSIYNILLYFFRKEDTAPLYLGFFSLVWTINRFNLQSPVIYNLFADQRIAYMIDHVMIILNVPLCLMAIKSLYPEEMSGRIIRISQITACIYILILSFCGFKTSEQVMNTYYLLCLVFIACAVYAFIKIVYNRKNDAMLLCIGFTAMFAGCINDILYVLRIINTYFICQYALLVLCISTTMIISRRFSRALRDVEKLSRDLEDKNILLVRMDRVKDQFLANTSHELRTPLHGMIGLSESMIQGAAGSLPPEAIENLSLISSSGHRLAGMVTDLLDMAKIEAGGLSLILRPVDIYSLSETAIKLSLPLVGEKPLEIINSIKPDIPRVNADEDRIKQVIYNLLGNAVKFTASGTIEISASVIGPCRGNGSGKEIEVRVSDTGIGVPEEYREKIFEAYQQVDGGDARAYPGTGLGLSIAKQIIVQHNGKIRVMPREGGGSVFAFTLPVSDSQATDYGDRAIEKIDQPLQAGTGGVRLPAGVNDIVFKNNPLFLVVDDDPVNVRILRNYLESRKCRVITAPDGIKALDIIDRDESIGLVLLDIMMPGMSGYEVCRRIREKRQADDLPVIMLTAKNMMSDINAAFEAGANDYIVKPFNISELLARVNTMLKLKNIRKSAAGGITIRDRNSSYPVMFGDIVYITSKMKKIVIHTKERDLELPLLLKDIIDQLPPDIFIRVHKSFIININCVSNISHVVSGRYKVKLKDDDDTELPVGPSFLEDLRKKIQF